VAISGHGEPQGEGMLESAPIRTGKVQIASATRRMTLPPRAARSEYSPFNPLLAQLGASR